jgi:hypothetical protein
MLDDRIDEATETRAKTLVTVGHLCTQMLASKRGKSPTLGPLQEKEAEINLVEEIVL